MKHGASASVHRKHGVYSSWYTTSSACVRTTEVTVVLPLGAWGGKGCSVPGGGTVGRIVSLSSSSVVGSSIRSGDESGSGLAKGA
jgi:hypothetical protein